MRCKRGTVKNRKTGKCEPKTAKKARAQSVFPKEFPTVNLRFPSTETGAFNKLKKDYAMDVDYIYPMLLAVAQFHYANVPHVAAAQERFFLAVLDDLSASQKSKLYGMLYNMRIKANGGVPTFSNAITTPTQMMAIFIADMELGRAYIAPMLKNIARGNLSPDPLVATAQKQFLQEFIDLGPQNNVISNRIYADVLASVHMEN